MPGFLADFWPGFLALDKTAGWGGDQGGCLGGIQFCSTTRTEKYSFTVGSDHVLKIPCIKNPILLKIPYIKNLAVDISSSSQNALFPAAKKKVDFADDGMDG